jgi:hypothetical protein
MKVRSVHRHIEGKVIEWLDYMLIHWQTINDEIMFNSDLSSQLRHDLVVQVNLGCLQRVRLFDECEPCLLIELVRDVVRWHRTRVVTVLVCL